MYLTQTTSVLLLHSTDTREEGRMGGKQLVRRFDGGGHYEKSIHQFNYYKGQKLSLMDINIGSTFTARRDQGRPRRRCQEQVCLRCTAYL